MRYRKIQVPPSVQSLGGDWADMYLSDHDLERLDDDDLRGLRRTVG